MDVSQDLKLTKPLIDAGVIADLNSSDHGTTNNDITVTVGFRPKIIKLNYYVQGYSAGNARQEIGIAVFEGTTLKYNNFLNLGLTNSSDNAVETLETNLPNSSAAISVGASSGSGVQQEVSINSISDTGFVVRRIRTDTSATGLTSRVKLSFEAYE